MIKKYISIISVVSIFIVGWGVYQYYDLMQLKKEELAELKEIQKYNLNEALKPKGRINFRSKSNKYVQIKITNSNNDLTQWEIFQPDGRFASYGTYDTGDIKLELIVNEEVVDTVVFGLHKGGMVDFDVYEDRIEERIITSNKSLQPTAEGGG